MSSISGQYKIHRHFQEIPIDANYGIRRYENLNKDGINVPITYATEFTRGVTPASAEAAVRAAPSPSMHNGGRVDSSVESRHNCFNRGSVPFNSFKPTPSNNADYPAWQQSQVMSRQQMANNTPQNHSYHPVRLLKLHFLK